jgi:hypothetical protein
MKPATTLLKNLLLPKLEKDSQFEVSKLSESFLESFVIALCDFEKDAKPVYVLLHRLELNNTEKVISKLETLYTAFIKEMAEHLVLGHSSEICNLLIENKNPTFEKEVLFFKHLKNAITKIERKQIKEELPDYFNKISFTIDDETITNVVKKKSREELKKKMAGWDEELILSEEPLVHSFAPKRDTKVISLTWIKYAAAACLVLGLGVWFFKQSNPDLPEVENNVVSTDTTSVIQPKSIKAPSEVIADNTKVIEKQVQYPSDFGFTNTTSSKIIKLYIKKISKNSSITNSYEFDGTQLVIYSNDLKISYSILSLDDKIYYLKKDTGYYQLYLSKDPKELKLLKDDTLIEQLEKTSFDNEE